VIGKLGPQSVEVVAQTTTSIFSDKRNALVNSANDQPFLVLAHASSF